MSRVRKKRGWIYWGAYGCVTSFALTGIVLWMVSYVWVLRLWCPLSVGSSVECGVNSGTFSLRYYTGIRYSFASHIHRLQPDDLTPYEQLEGLWHFYFWQDTLNTTWLGFPVWCLILPLSVWPIYLCVRVIPTKPRSGQCPACGYDLRGSKGSINCPECGEAIPENVAGDAGG